MSNLNSTHANMLVYGQNIAHDRGLTNFELLEYARKLKIKGFRGVFMRDTLPSQPFTKECGIMNFNTSKQAGSHWVCYAKNEHERIYFDSYAQVTPIELQTYLKTQTEKNLKQQVIQRNTDIVQRINTHICGHLCLFVLTSLTREQLSYQEVLDVLNDGYTRGDW